MMKCPVCGSEANKILLGVFPMKMCSNEECGCVWGFWSTVGPWLYDHLGPKNGGWLFMTYIGGYWKALWHSIGGGGE